jgi:ActR/RegA family two-component response regulator
MRRHATTTSDMSTEAPDDPIHTDWPTLDVLSVRYIERVLAHVGLNKTHAARILGIDPRTMRRISLKLKTGRCPNINTGHHKRGARPAPTAGPG